MRRTRLGIVAAVMMLWAGPAGAAGADAGVKAEILAMDAVLFEQGFNRCDIKAFQDAIADDLEFYHDVGGIDLGKAAFVDKFTTAICSGAPQKPIRRLVPESVTVFPMYSNGVLYGAVQSGDHRFFLDDGKAPPVLTGSAKFLHYWVKTDHGWKLKRAFSFDHEPAR